MPGLSPSTRPTSSDTVAVFGNSGSIQPTPASLSHAQITVLDVLPGPELGRGSAPDDLALLERPRVGAAAAVRRGRDEVLAHREVRKDLAALRHEADPDLRDAVGRQPVDRPAEEPDLTGLRPHDPHDGAHGGRLAHAVPAEERHNLARIDLEAHAEEHPAHAVPCLDRLDRAHQYVASSPR